MASLEAMSSLTGWYTWTYPGGEFNVAFRPYGSFFCPKFQARASWTESDGKVLVDWGTYGKYELHITQPEPLVLEGCLAGNPTSWRRCTFTRPFTAGETIMFTGGSEWNFQYEKGSFPVEFIADGLNHFVCQSYPAHSHWSMDSETNQIVVNWDKYGTYDLTLDPETMTMSGHKQGQPTNWRRLTFIRSLGVEALTTLPAHDHSHSHKHGEHCDH